MKALLIAILIVAMPLTVVAENRPHEGMSQGSMKLHETMDKSSKMPNMKMTGDADEELL